MYCVQREGMPELSWWGTLEWSPRQKRQLLTIFTYFLVGKVAEIFMKQSWQPGLSFPQEFTPRVSLRQVLPCKSHSSGAKVARFCRDKRSVRGCNVVTLRIDEQSVGKSRLLFLEWQPGLHSSGLLHLLVLRPATWSGRFWTVCRDLLTVIDGFCLHVKESPHRTRSCFFCPLTESSTFPLQTHMV